MPQHRQASSPTLQKALDLLEKAHGTKASLSETCASAVELAAYMLEEACSIQTYSEKRRQQQLARMMQDPKGKAFTTCMTDQGFRSHNARRAANQINYLIDQFGVPSYFDPLKRLQLKAFRVLSPFFANFLMPLVTFALRKETSSVILPGEYKALTRHMQLRRDQGVRVNLNHLGEAILGEEEARRRLEVYLKDLEQKEIEYISVKISTIFSQINLLSWDKTIESVAARLRELYRAAMNNTFQRADGTVVTKFVNLDMEEYRDLLLTKDIFKKVLSEPEFHKFSAGIVLQAYLPDSFDIQKELTEWAMHRLNEGGAPIKIRIVKGANLAMEQFEASLRIWPQAPYRTKEEVDANFKRMVVYGSMQQRAKACHLGIGSHNLFDIAFAMLLRAENKVESYISFEMLEGMADHIRRVVQILSGDMLLYCPVAKKEDFQSAIAYLIRRLDENTGPENFLRYTFGLKVGSKQWQQQAQLFTKACQEMDTTYHHARRSQDRNAAPHPIDPHEPFTNEEDTDFSLPANRLWAQQIIQRWYKKKITDIPCVIDNKEYHEGLPRGKAADPAYPTEVLYQYSIASWDEIDKALNCAKAQQISWQKVSIEEKAHIFAKVAHMMRQKRSELIGVMIADGGKTIAEGDPEVSEAIDFVEYYSRSMQKMHACTDIEWKNKGTILITPPWNFPVSIPAGGIMAALATGNCVLFKPAPEAVLSGYELAKIFWEGGVPKNVLQFFSCHDNPEGSRLIADKRVDAVILTGATSTAKLFHKLRPGIDLSAETGGKNALIITAMADRDAAIKDLIQSAFGHSGQKCSAASLAILEAEVYDDLHFLCQLKDAAESLKVGFAWDLSSKVVPLIKEPENDLLRAMTTLEPGETWLVEPKKDPHNPQLWSVGIKLGVQPGSWIQQTELFGPVLSIVRAKNLDEAIKIANSTPYGLTSGISSLDEREHDIWLKKIEAGNCYINRSITGAIVKRQPFGGCKASGWGQGAKAGGPNYLFQFAKPLQKSLPKEKHPLTDEINQLTSFLQKVNLSTDELGIWYASVANYSFWSHKFSQDYKSGHSQYHNDLVIGQDNVLIYKPHSQMCFRIQGADSPLDIFRVIAAAIATKAPLEISWCKESSHVHFNDAWKKIFPHLLFKEESENDFLQRVKKGAFKRLRLIHTPSEEIIACAQLSGLYLCSTPVLANGRIELLNYLREMAISYDYHRYGNLGVREKEHRNPIL